MALLQPLALMAAMIIPLILLLYMLKKKTLPQTISSTMLWEMLERPASASFNWNKLLKNLLLYLQLLIACLLVLALARPAFHWFAGPGGASSTVIIVDTSISMAVRDDGVERLERARQHLNDIITAKGAQDSIAVVRMGEKASVICGISTGKEALLQAADQIVVTGSRADLDDALFLAENMIYALEDPQIVIISDGGFTDSALQVSCPVDYIAVGGSAVENLFIENMIVDGERLYLTVSNNGTAPSQSVVRVWDSGDTLVGQREIALYPGESSVLTWRNLNPSPWYRGEIVNQDQLPWDNIFHVVNTRYRANRLLLVTEGNLFLERALMLQPSLSISKVKPDQYHPEMAASYDYYVFDGFIPAALPAAPLVIFDPPHPNAHLATAPPLQPENLHAAHHPLMAHVDLGEVRISFSKMLQGGRPLITCAAGTLAAELEQQGHPAVIFGFAVQAGDLPLRPAFPILIRNIIDFFTGMELHLGQFCYGQPLLVDPPYLVQELVITAPGGNQETAAAPFPYRGRPLVETGIYTVTTEDETHLVAVNPPLSPEMLTFREAIEINGVTVEGRQGGGLPSPLLTPLLLLALLASGMEWWVDNRGY